MDYVDGISASRIAGSVGVLDNWNNFNFSFWKYTKSGEGEFMYNGGYICERERSDL